MLLVHSTNLGDTASMGPAVDALAQATQVLNVCEGQYLSKAPSWANLPTTTKAKIEQIIRDAVTGPSTASDYMAQMFFYSLADQFLTIAPTDVLAQFWKCASYYGQSQNWIAEVPYNGHFMNRAAWQQDECSPPWAPDVGCSFAWFCSALYERQRAFIPISSEPTATQSVITGAQTVQIIAPSSAGSQIIAQPYGQTAQTAQVVTMPTYIPAPPAPVSAGLPTSYTPPGTVTTPPVTTSSNIPAAQPPQPAADNSGLGWLIVAAAAFMVLKKKGERY